MTKLLLFVCVVLVFLLTYFIYDLYERLKTLTDKFEQLRYATENLVAAEIKISESHTKSLKTFSDALINHLKQHNNGEV